MNYNFTDRTRKVLALAREEALRLNHEYIGTEHILLGLIDEGEGVAAAVLMRLNVDFEQLRARVEQSVRKGSSVEALPASAELPYTSKAKRVLEYAMRESGSLQHSYVGTEHLLIGLLGDDKSIAAQVLAAHGVTLVQARDITLTFLGANRPPEQATSKTHRPAPGTERLLRQLKATYHGPSWHGPTLRELLADVTPEQAAKRGIASAHSIWEIVVHSAGWKRVVATRLEGQKASLQGEADWPKVEDTSAQAWQAALAELDAAHDAVMQRVTELGDTDLDRQVPGQKVSVYATVHGVIQHDIYHAGQIALLKKTVGR